MFICFNRNCGSPFSSSPFCLILLPPQFQFKNISRRTVLSFFCMNQGWLVSGELSLLRLALGAHPGPSTVHSVWDLCQGAISHSKENFSDGEKILFWGGKIIETQHIVINCCCGNSEAKLDRETVSGHCGGSI